MNKRVFVNGWGFHGQQSYILCVKSEQKFWSQKQSNCTLFRVLISTQRQRVSLPVLLNLLYGEKCKILLNKFHKT